jgi:hypothetical protein
MEGKVNEHTISELVAVNREQERQIRILEAELAGLRPGRPATVEEILSGWKLAHIVDLHYYEGALTSVYIHHGNDGGHLFFLLRWCGNTDNATLWMAAPVEGERLFEYVGDIVTGRQLISEAIGGKVYMVLVDREHLTKGGSYEIKEAIPVGEIPNAYLSNEECMCNMKDFRCC